MPSLSEKQLQIMAFPYTKYEALICDGAVRSGKTSIMTISFIDWAMREFNNQNFAMAGKTVGSCTRNVVKPYTSLDYARERYKITLKRTENLLIISNGKHTNNFYLFGGKDERSQDLIQGITLAGLFLDEVALMPRSFVEQALARCSVEGSRLWFNCNPEHPEHYFHKEWILKAKEQRALHLHFLMSDNPSLSQEMLERYERRYSGVFYDRYIRGIWVVAEGLIFQCFDKERHVKTVAEPFAEYTVGMDYGIQNPTAMGLWGRKGDKWHCIKEYYHSGRDSNQQKTDEEYYTELLKLTDGTSCSELIIDPSASSFISLVKKKGKFRVRKAKNDVLAGIQAVSECLVNDRISFSPQCKNGIKEFGLYRWDEKSVDDKPIKDNDHFMDMCRYVVFTKRIHKEVSHEPVTGMWS